MGKLIYDERNGYDYISDNGVKYDLFEGKSLSGITTSDILYIHLSYDEELFETVARFTSRSDELVGWFFGASFIGDEKYQDEYVEYVDDMVKDYEEKHPEIVEYYNPRKKMIKKIRETVDAYLITNRYVLEEKEIKDLEEQLRFLDEF